MSLQQSCFSFGLGMTCKGFPGPGVMSSLLANPMQEFIEPHGQEKVHELFEHFLIKHPKKYANMVDKKEHNQRRDIFRQNLRYEMLYIYCEKPFWGCWEQTLFFSQLQTFSDLNNVATYKRSWTQIQKLNGLRLAKTIRLLGLEKKAGSLLLLLLLCLLNNPTD